MKALIDIRLSKLTDATTSPERQLEDSQGLCDQRSYEVVATVEDLDVSATLTSPFERPALREWIGDGKNDHGRMHEIDVLVFWKMDRVVRNLFDLVDLIRWCRAHSVALVSVQEPFMDLTSPFGELIAILLAWVAQMEAANISTRSASAAQYNIRAGKYRGGVPPWGYLPDDSTGEWRYVQDQEQVKVIHEVVHRVLAGEPLRRIVVELTERGVPTPRDSFAQSRKRKTKGHEWYVSALKRSLTSQTLLGYAVAREALIDNQGNIQRDSRGKKLFGPETIIRDEDGSPMVRATPILTREVFDRLQAELASRESHKEPTARSSGLLLRVLYCESCDKPMYRLNGGPGRSPRYRCASAQSKSGACDNRSVLMADADDLVTEHLLTTFGDSDRLERVWDSGSDHSAELAEIDTTLTDLADQLGTVAFRKGTPQRERLDQRIAVLSARQAALSAEEVRPASWVWRSTGEKFADWWDAQDVQARNMWLRSMGVRLTFKGAPGTNEANWHLSMPYLERFEEQLRFGEAAQGVTRRILEPRTEEESRENFEKLNRGAEEARTPKTRPERP